MNFDVSLSILRYQSSDDDNIIFFSEVEDASFMYATYLITELIVHI